MWPRKIVSQKSASLGLSHAGQNPSDPCSSGDAHTSSARKKRQGCGSRWYAKTKRFSQMETRRVSEELSAKYWSSLPRFEYCATSKLRRQVTKVLQTSMPLEMAELVCQNEVDHAKITLTTLASSGPNTPWRSADLLFAHPRPDPGTLRSSRLLFRATST